MTVTKISDLFGASNREGLGLSQFFPMYTGTGTEGLGFPVIELNDRVYLRSGVYTLPSNADSDVQQMQHLQLFDTVQSASAVNEQGSVVIASNGSGTCVAGQIQTPATTNLSVSTDNGVTWTNIKVGTTANQYSNVVWTGSRFVIAVGTSGGTAPMIYNSPTGLAGSWVAGTGTLPADTAPCTDLVTDGAGKVLYLHSSGGWYSANHGVTWASFTNSYTRGFVLNNLWCLFNDASAAYATASLSSPNTKTARTLPVKTPSTIYLASNRTNLGVLSADSNAKSLLISTDGINWETKPVPMSSATTGIVYSNSRFYMICNSAISIDTNESPGAGFLPYQLYTTSDFINYRVVNLIPRAIGLETANTEQRLVGVGQNDRVFFAIDAFSNTLTTSLRYWDYKTTPDYIGTARNVRVNSNSFYWRIK